MTGGGHERRLRDLLADFIETGIDLLDALDQAAEEREDDEREVLCEDEGAVDAQSLRFGA